MVNTSGHTGRFCLIFRHRKIAFNILPLGMTCCRLYFVDILSQVSILSSYLWFYMFPFYNMDMQKFVRYFLHLLR